MNCEILLVSFSVSLSDLSVLCLTLFSLFEDENEIMGFAAIRLMVTYCPNAPIAGPKMCNGPTRRASKLINLVLEPAELGVPFGALNMFAPIPDIFCFIFKGVVVVE